MEAPVTFNALALIAAKKRAEEQAAAEEQASKADPKQLGVPYPLQGNVQDYPLRK